MTSDQMQELAEIFPLLGDPTGLAIVLAVGDGTRPVGVVAESLGLGPPLVSRHLPMSASRIRRNEMSAHCCDHDRGHDHGDAGDDPVYRRVLVAALAVNLAMFLIEIFTSRAAQSDALLADSIDFLGDAANYAVSLWVLGASLALRARASLLKAASMAGFGVWVLGSTAIHAVAGTVPEAPTMGVVGVLALAANLGVAVMLFRFRDGDSNRRSVWLCTRNDAIGNLAVLAAAAGVFGTGHGWPDALVAAGMGLLALHSAVRVARQAFGEIRVAAA